MELPDSGCCKRGISKLSKNTNEVLSEQIICKT